MALMQRAESVAGLCDPLELLDSHPELGVGEGPAGQASHSLHLNVYSEGPSVTWGVLLGRRCESTAAFVTDSLWLASVFRCI